LRKRKWQEASLAVEAHRRAADYPPAVGSEFDGTPVIIGEIKIDATRILGEADMDGALRRLKLRPRFEQIELRGNPEQALSVLAASPLLRGHGRRALTGQATHQSG
jgi:hypothetical protein